MLPIAGRPLVQHIWNRARCTDYPVFLAISDRPEDDRLAALALQDDVPVFRGSLEDVLGRAVAAAEHWNLAGFARLCGDRPYFCIDSMNSALDILAEELRSGSGDTDLLSNAAEATPVAGLATEVIRTAALRHAAESSCDEYQKEHVTPKLYADSQYRVQTIEEPAEFYDGPGLAVDTQEDYLRLSRLSETESRLDIPALDALKSMRKLQGWP